MGVATRVRVRVLTASMTKSSIWDRTRGRHRDEVMTCSHFRGSKLDEVRIRG